MTPRLCQAALAFSLAAGVRAQPPAPTYIPQTKFSTGQDVQPVFEGWLRNADGTFTMVFGYFNRNWQEELAIPAGPDNKLEPGDPLEPGDLVFFGADTNHVDHVGIVLNGSEMVDAPHTGALVRIEPFAWRDYLGATRPAGG